MATPLHQALRQFHAFLSEIHRNFPSLHNCRRHFSRSNETEDNDDVFTPPVYTKVCALFRRLHGSYEALKYGTLLDGLADLTGGIAESIPLQSIGGNNKCDDVVRSFLEMTSVVTCTVANPDVSHAILFNCAFY